MVKRSIRGYDPLQVRERMDHMRSEHELASSVLQQEIAQLSEDNRNLHEEITSFQYQLQVPWEESLGHTLAEAHLSQTMLVMMAMEELQQSEAKHEDLADDEKESKESVRVELLRKLQKLQIKLENEQEGG
ncbi:hypothetical protein M5X11_04465 [Paenibacillus alginolyticus]|uniref:hypothetical protein n=1 Tax=Paenibacillus alginolyticus TaxID=59839 RepID=UPI0004246293|nr:hypothetical protein [Paenibacillus alginolyticus]MCY9664231.1 hypothetical protein [Paenibacillus alginolyticus]